MGLKITSSVFYATLCLCLISTETPLSYSCATPLKKQNKKTSWNDPSSHT